MKPDIDLTLHPLAEAYPGKRFLLQSPGEITDTLDELGVDVVTLGNNHIYDWQESGVQSTVRALDAARLDHVGGGSTAEVGARGVLMEIEGVQVGMLSLSTVTGDFVNDNLATSEVPPPDLDPADAWQYERRTFGYGQPGDPEYVETIDRLPREAWDLFKKLEADLDAARGAGLWTAMVTDGPYPELQVWVARRGHGGAVPFSPEAVEAAIANLRIRGAHLVVVQLHSGYQFAAASSAFTASAARSSIDAGADLIVAHHPHVPQGFEWYDGHLIAYSLGNFVFDQDFLITFPSLILRTVFEGQNLIEARILPVVIDNYRPVPATGQTASNILTMLDARSALDARADRNADGLVVAGNRNQGR